MSLTLLVSATAWCLLFLVAASSRRGVVALCRLGGGVARLRGGETPPPSQTTNPRRPTPNTGSLGKVDDPGPEGIPNLRVHCSAASAFAAAFAQEDGAAGNLFPSNGTSRPGDLLFSFLTPVTPDCQFSRPSGQPQDRADRMAATNHRTKVWWPADPQLFGLSGLGCANPGWLKPGSPERKQAPASRAPMRHRSVHPWCRRPPAFGSPSG